MKRKDHPLPGEKLNYKSAEGPDINRTLVIFFTGKNMYKIILITCLLLITTVSAQNYQLNGYVGFGYSQFLTDLDLDGLNKSGYNGIIRLMWHPEHLLSVGMETGYHYLYSYEVSNVTTEFGVTDARSSLTAIPLFFVAAMEILPSVELIGGMGPTFLHTFFDSFGNETKSSQISTSYFVAGRYEYPLDNALAVSGELSFYRINKIEDSTLSLRVILSYQLLNY